MSTERKVGIRNKPFTIFTQDSNSQYKENTMHTHQRCKSSLLQLTTENESSSLMTKLIIQSNILKEYNTWVNILLSIINSKSTNENYCDLGTPIQKGLEHIGKMQTDNFQIKTKLIDEIAKNSNKEHQIIEKKSILQLGKIEIDKCIPEQISFEKSQLMSNLQVMANELDEQSEKNRSLNETIAKEENASYYNTVNELFKLQNENLLLKQVLELQNDKNKSLYFEQHHQSHPSKSRLFSSTQCPSSTRKLGNYLIEEEEDWRDDFGIFTCKKAE